MIFQEKITHILKSTHQCFPETLRSTPNIMPVLRSIPASTPVFLTEPITNLSFWVTADTFRTEDKIFFQTKYPVLPFNATIWCQSDGSLLSLTVTRSLLVYVDLMCCMSLHVSYWREIIMKQGIATIWLMWIFWIFVLLVAYAHEWRHRYSNAFVWTTCSKSVSILSFFQTVPVS